MNINVALQILQLAIALFRPDSAGIAQTLKDLVRAVAKAYHDHVGEPIDPSLIQPEAPVPAE
jgi:hypothetical protein